MKKNIFIIIVLVIIAAAILGAFYWSRDNKEAVNPVPNNYETGGNQTYVQNGVTYQKYWNEDFGISFSYRVDPDGYTLVEQNASALSSTQDIEKFLSLYDKNEYAEFKADNIAREAPKSISVRIFKNQNNLSAQEWINNNSAIANYRPSGIKPQNVSFGGVSGVRYNASGLYENDVVVLNNNYKMYIFNVEYDSPTDKIRNDFSNLLNSLIMF